MEKPSWKERLRYRFDNYMSHGSKNLITLLVVFSVVLVFIVICIMTAVMREPGSFLSNLWNGYVTLINAWMPEYDPGDPPQFAYLFFMAVIAVIGILFTSTLIGIITSMIEEKVVSLRKGNSGVLESGHTVVLGYRSGEYMLLKQLVLAAFDEPCTIVVAGEMEKDEMEEQIKDNVEIHNNVKIICRSIDVFDPAALERLAVKRAKTIIISPNSNPHVVKMMLALSVLIGSTDNVRINGILYGDEYNLPESVMKKHNIFTLHTNDTIAKLIALSCTHPGLSEVFREIFTNEGNEFFLTQISGAEGMSFSELSARMDHAVPAGFKRNGHVRINPPVWTKIQAGDEILIFAEKRDAWILRDAPLPEVTPVNKTKTEFARLRPYTKVCIFGYNKSLKTILYELPENVKHVLLINPPAENSIDAFRELFPNRSIEAAEMPSPDDAALVTLAEDYRHFIILSNHTGDDENDDMVTSSLLLRLRDVRERYHFEFNITAEMQREANQRLVETDDHTDFVVASNMSALILAQLSKSPELKPVFSELLSSKDNEIYLIKAKYLDAAGSCTIGQLRQKMLGIGYVLIGYVNFRGEYRFNPPLDKPVTPEGEDYMILIGENDIPAEE